MIQNRSFKCVWGGARKTGRTKYNSNRRKSRSRKKNGFTFAETLLAMLVCMLCASLLMMQATTIRNTIHIHEDSQEQFAILQIRELAVFARSVSVQNGNLVLTGVDKTETILLDRNRLVKKPGYEIFMENIDEARFHQNKGEIELEVRYGKTKKTWQIQ